MRPTICKIRGCARLYEYSRRIDGKETTTHQCNQHMPGDMTVWFHDCSAVDKERCKMLRKALTKTVEAE